MGEDQLGGCCCCCCSCLCSFFFGKRLTEGIAGGMESTGGSVVE